MSIVETRMIAYAEVSSSGEISGETKLIQKLYAATTPSRRTAVAMEEQTIERLKNGDQTALGTVFNLYAAKLYRMAQRILGDAMDNEEFVQDVFWTVYRKANSFKGEAKFSAGLYRLTVNAALGRIRKRKQQSAIEYQAYFRRSPRHSYWP
jgi:Sigma-70 region 2